MRRPGPAPDPGQGSPRLRHACVALALLGGMAGACASSGHVWIEPPVTGLLTLDAPATPAAGPAGTVAPHRVENPQAMMFVVADRLVRAIQCELGLDGSGRLFYVAIQADHFDELVAGRARIVASCALDGARWRIVVEKPPQRGSPAPLSADDRRMSWNVEGHSLRVTGGWERL